MDAYSTHLSIFWSGKRKVNVNHNSDYSVIFCHDPFSQLAIVVSSHMKLMHTRTDSPPFDSTLRNKGYYYTSDSLWKIWLVESIQSIHNSLWTWHHKCNICCRYCIYHVKFNVCLVTKPLGVFSSETKWLNDALLFLRMNYVKNV